VTLSTYDSFQHNFPPSLATSPIPREKKALTEGVGARSSGGGIRQKTGRDVASNAPLEFNPRLVQKDVSARTRGPLPFFHNGGPLFPAVTTLCATFEMALPV
jgi:hypothetical protein